MNNPTPPKALNPLFIILLSMGLFGMIAATVMLMSTRDTTTTSQETDISAQIATPANSPIGKIGANFELTALNGERVSLAQFRGRAVFINLWWTGCPPCVREFPAFQQFMEEQGDNGAVILAINPIDDLSAARSFVQDLGATDVIVLLDPDNTVIERYPNQNLFPTTYLVDEQGIVRERKIGEVSLETLYIYLESIANEAGSS